MTRPLLALLSVLLISGCASTGGSYYSYEGAGDYYYGASAADVVYYAPGLSYGLSAYAPGWGYGGGYGYGYGYGYGSWNNPWGYGYAYPPIWWVPSQPHQGPGVARAGRVERDRAMRSSFDRRDTVSAPESARMQFPQPMRRDGLYGNHPPVDVQRRARYEQRQPASRSGAPQRSSSPPPRQSMPIRASSRPIPSPARSVPVPRTSSPRQ